MPSVEISRSDSYGASRVVLIDDSTPLADLLPLAQKALENAHASNTRITSSDVTL